jgi:tetratricopeptide (TPR) repeat protein
MDNLAGTAAARLAQLERYLAEDATNLALLGDACDAALHAGEKERAEAHLQAAQRLGAESTDWTARAARVAIARGNWADALLLLQRLHEEVGEHPVIAHDIAFVRFREGDFAGCRAALTPWLQQAVEPETSSALQVLWLRAGHHLGLLAEAAQWALEQADLGRLQPAAAGVASLIAIDLGDFVRARELADQAIEGASPLSEALLARACVAIAERDAATAQGLLRKALELNPQEGRTWSTLGMASLQAQDLPQARVQFARATTLMPRHIGTWHGLGWTCLLLQDWPAALAAFQQALALDPNFGESHGAVGLALSLASRHDEAEPCLARADRLDRGNVTGRFARALARGKLHDRAALHELAARLLDRPGVFKPRLSDEVDA